MKDNKNNINAFINGTANGGFNLDEIINAAALMEELAREATPLAKFLGPQFVAEQLLPLPPWAATEPEKLKTTVQNQLNAIIGGPPLYNEGRFRGITLSAYSRKLLRKNPVGEKLVALNKWLLLDALPAHFRRPNGRSKDPVQKSASVHQLENGKWVVLVNLLEPREIEGKTRSGRQKFQRATESDANILAHDINAVLLGKEPARQLTKRELEIVKKLLWEEIEPHHPDWVEHIDQMVEHCETTGFDPAQKANCPSFFEAARLFWRLHVRKLEPESQMNYRNALAFALPAFGECNSYMVTDAMITKLAYGSEPLAYLKTSWKKGEAKKDAQKRLWDTPVQSKSRRPWTHHMLYRFLSCMRKFKSWMHSSIDPATGARRNWCPPTEIVLPDEPKLVAGNIGDDVTAGKIMDRARCSACRPGHSNMPRGCATAKTSAIAVRTTGFSGAALAKLTVLTAKI